jgi:hemerythrin
LARLVLAPALLTGIKRIDVDHRMLVDIVNALHDERAPEKLQPILGALSSYAEEHFRREEDLMESSSFPEMLAHIREHRKFSHLVGTLERAWRTDAGSVDIKRTLRFLNTWLFQHIGVADKALTAHVLAQEAGALRPEAAPPLETLTLRIPASGRDLLMEVVDALLEGGARLGAIRAALAAPQPPAPDIGAAQGDAGN